MGQEPNRLLELCDLLTSDPNVINSKFREFFSNLYTYDSTVNSNEIEDFLGGLNISAISSDYKELLEQPSKR